MGKPTTEVGRKLDSAWPGSHLDRLAWHALILAIEREAARDALVALRKEVGELPIFSVATGDYVDRTSALDSIAAAMPEEVQP